MSTIPTPKPLPLTLVAPPPKEPTNPPKSLDFSRQTFWRRLYIEPTLSSVDGPGLEVRFVRGSQSELCLMTPTEARQAAKALEYWAQQSEWRFRNQGQRLLHVEVREPSGCSTLRLATADEIRESAQAHAKGHCPHLCVYDAYGGRFCGVCGTYLGPS